MININKHENFNWGDGKYNCYKTSIGDLIVININWNFDGFVVCINNIKYKKTFANLDEAKTFALAKTSDLIMKAIDVLEEGNKE